MQTVSRIEAEMAAREAAEVAKRKYSVASEHSRQQRRLQNERQRQPAACEPSEQKCPDRSLPVPLSPSSKQQQVPLPHLVELPPPPTPTSSSLPPPTPPPLQKGTSLLRRYDRIEIEEETEAGRYSQEFERAAAALNPHIRRALVDDEVDHENENELLKLLLCDKLTTTRHILCRCGAISTHGCESLRRAVDDERDVTRDSVDSMSQHQLNVDATRLIELIGKQEVCGLWRLADELLAMQRAEARARADAAGLVDVPPQVQTATEAADGGWYVDIFIRRYTRETRPWIGFHHDVSTVTINVALSDDNEHEGGRLHAVVNGRHTTITRQLGEATVHGDDIMHAVSSMRAGVRYSLILFFYALREEEGSREYESIPRHEYEVGNGAGGDRSREEMLQAVAQMPSPAASATPKVPQHRGAAALDDMIDAEGLLRWSEDSHGKSGWTFRETLRELK